MVIASANTHHLRDQFPIFSRDVSPGVPLVYFDSAATSQKPECVLKAMDRYYRLMNANIHRGVHTLAEEATAAYEHARANIAGFIHCGNPRQVIFTRNATEAINLVAFSWGRKHLQTGDIVVLTEMEHHSNLVPWQMLAQERNISLEFIPVGENGLLDLDRFKSILEKTPKLVAFTHMSNVLGTINPARDLIAMAHQAGAITLVDGAQAAPHFTLNVEDLDADFYVFSAHKMCGPTGIGILFGKESILEEMPPFLGGGDMIRKVELTGFKPNELPYKFEAGTPAIAEAIGFGAAVDFLSSVGMDTVALIEHDLTRYALDKLGNIPGLRILGPALDQRGGVVSFVMDNIHPHDVAQILDSMGIAIRAGHHCAMPLHARFNLPASSRASFYLYNTSEEIDLLLLALEKVNRTFK